MDVKVLNLPSGYNPNDFVVKISDIYGNVVEGNMPLSTGVNSDEQSVDQLRVYPNPTKGRVTINGVLGKQIELLDVTGRVIKEISVNSSSEYNLTDVTPGIYFVRSESQIVRLVID